MMQSKEIRAEGTRSASLPVRNNQKFLFILSKDRRLYTHEIYKYPAKFSRGFPDGLLKGIPTGGVAGKLQRTMGIS